LSGYKFKDSGEGNLFTLPEGTTIPPAGYLTICEDSTKFKFFHPEATNFIGNLQFGLSSDGEAIFLIDPAGSILDSVTYGISLPWDPKANGNGYTLALINPELDNAMPTSWVSGKRLGTPSARNDVYSDIKKTSNLPSDFSLSQNFPNPFNPETKILVTLPQRNEVKLKVYDVLGNQVSVLADGEFEAGSYEFIFDATGLPSGIYFYQMSAGKFNSVKKMVVLK